MRYGTFLGAFELDNSDLPDALSPESLVETGVDADVLGAHLLLGELADLINGTRGALLEAAETRFCCQALLWGDE